MKIFDLLVVVDPFSFQMSLFLLTILCRMTFLSANIIIDKDSAGVYVLKSKVAFPNVIFGVEKMV